MKTRKRFLPSVLSLVAAATLLVAAPYRADQAPPEGVSPPPPPLQIPAKEHARANAIPPSPESIEHGKTTFATQCAMCHGTRGDGKGDLAARLAMKLPDLTDPAQQRKRTDGDLFFIISEGHGDMQGEGSRMPEDWRWNLVNYIRTLARG